MGATKTGTVTPFSDQNLKPPRLGRENLTRQRLLEAIHTFEGPLITLRAPPRYGKTTLLSQFFWAQQTRSRRAVAWLSLTKEESNPSRFLGALSLAVRRVCPEVGERLQLLLLSGADCPPEVAMMLLCNEITQSGQSLTLVIDNGDFLNGSPVWSLLDMLLDNASNDIQVLLASQHAAPLSLVMRDPHRCLRVEEDGMRYTTDEARGLFDLLQPGIISEQLLHEYYEKTAGWPLGITLIAQSHSTGIEDTYATLDIHIQNFFENCCDELTADELEVLEASSILNFLNADLVASLLKKTNSDIAAHLENQLYTFKDKSGELVLLPLFRRFLQNRLDEREPDYQAVLHQRAELWHQDHGDIREVIYHGLFVSDANGILTYLEEVAVELMLRSELPTLIEWVSQLRKLDFDFSPHHEGLLELIEMWVLAFLFERNLVSERVETMFARLDNEEVFLTDTAYTTLLTIKTLNYAYSEQLVDAERLANEILKSRGELSNWSRGILQNILTYTNILSLNFARAEQYQEDRAAHIDEKNLFVKTYSESLLGHSQVQQTKFDSARVYLESSLEISSSYGGRDCIAAAIAAGYLSEYYYETRQLDQVESEIWFRLDTIDEGALIDAAFRAYISLARTLSFRKQFGKAREVLDRGISVALNRGWDRMRAVCLSEHIRIDLQEGRYINTEQSLAMLEEMDCARRITEPVVRSEVNYYVLIGRALSTQSSVVDSDLCNDCRSLAYRLEEKGALLRALRLRISLAHVYLANHNGEEAERELLTAIEDCMKAGCVSPLLDSGDLIYREVMRLVDTVESLSPYKGALSDYCRLPDKSEPTGEVPRHRQRNDEMSDEAGLSEKELEILTLLSSGLSNKDLSGLLDISVGTVKWHLSNIYRKLDVSSRTEAVFEAKISGLVV